MFFGWAVVRRPISFTDYRLRSAKLERVQLCTRLYDNCADGDVHNPSEDGLGAYPGRGCLEKRIFPLLRVAAHGE